MLCYKYLQEMTTHAVFYRKRLSKIEIVLNRIRISKKYVFKNIFSTFHTKTASTLIIIYVLKCFTTLCQNLTFRELLYYFFINFKTFDRFLTLLNFKLGIFLFYCEFLKILVTIPHLAHLLPYPQVLIGLEYFRNMDVEVKFKNM